MTLTLSPGPTDGVLHVDRQRHMGERRVRLSARGPGPRNFDAARLWANNKTPQKFRPGAPPANAIIHDPFGCWHDEDLAVPKFQVAASFCLWNGTSRSQLGLLGSGAIVSGALLGAGNRVSNEKIA